MDAPLGELRLGSPPSSLGRASALSSLMQSSADGTLNVARTVTNAQSSHDYKTNTAAFGPAQQLCRTHPRHCFEALLTQWQARASALSSRNPHASQRRTLVVMPPLEHHNTFSKHGVPGLFGKEGYQIGWTAYQGMIVRKLNELIAGEPYENDIPRNLLLKFARDPMAASIFNHASMAFNNHHFYNSFSTSPKPLEEYGQLKISLESTFGSIETLKMTMLDTAAAMFGPGFVWLVWCRDISPGPTVASKKGAWRILTTYLAGTPFPEAGYRQQGLDMNTNNQASFDQYRMPHHTQPVNSFGAFGVGAPTTREKAKIPPGGTSVLPVLCVSTWEHTYMYDYGVQGKRHYLSKWWDEIDWHTVDSTAPLAAKTVLEFER